MKKIKPIVVIVSMCILLWILWFKISEVTITDISEAEASGEFNDLKQIIALKLLPYVIEHTWLKIVTSIFLILVIVGSWMQLEGRTE